MLSEMLMYSRQIDLSIAERKIAFRMEYEQARKVERLEVALAVARARAATIVPARAV